VTSDPSRSNIAPNPEPPASSPSPSTIISPPAIGDSTSSPWPTTTMTSQALWPLTFVVSILFIILVPSTYSLFSSFKGSSTSLKPSSPPLGGTLPRKFTDATLNSKSQVSGCECTPCVDQRTRIRKREKGSVLGPKISKLYVVCWHAVKIGCIKRLTQGHLRHCWLGSLCLPRHTGFSTSVGIQNL
jgi:hypothetical protein